MFPHILLPGKSGQYPNYEKALVLANAVIHYSDSEAAPALCDGLLLPGGADINPRRYGEENTASLGIDEERDEVELRLAAAFIAAGKPIFGICRGHQLINVALGGTLIQHIEGHAAINGVDTVHSVRTAKESFLAGVYGEHFHVNSSHHQALGRLGSGLSPVQWCGDIIEAAAHATLPIYTVQWHPERLYEGGRGFDTVSGQRIIDWFAQQCE